MLEDRGFPAVLSNGGKMGALIRSYDWASTPLGGINGWLSPLKTTVGIMLRTAIPTGIYWGTDLILLYNDAWRDVIGDKHPGALGRPAEEVFPEIWSTIQPAFAEVQAGKGSVHTRNQLLPLLRHGNVEDAWFDFSFNEIPLEDGSVGGILNMARETTARHARRRANYAEYTL